MIKLSTTFVSDPGRVLGVGSHLNCECGKTYKLGQLLQLKWNNDKMQLTKESYCCPRCARDGDLIILIEDEYETPVAVIDQANREYTTRFELASRKIKKR